MCLSSFVNVNCCMDDRKPGKTLGFPGAADSVMEENELIPQPKLLPDSLRVIGGGRQGKYIGKGFIRNVFQNFRIRSKRLAVRLFR